MVAVILGRPRAWLDGLASILEFEPFRRPDNRPNPDLNTNSPISIRDSQVEDGADGCRDFGTSPGLAGRIGVDIGVWTGSRVKTAQTLISTPICERAAFTD